MKPSVWEHRDHEASCTVKAAWRVYVDAQTEADAAWFRYTDDMQTGKDAALAYAGWVDHCRRAREAYRAYRRAKRMQYSTPPARAS